MKERVYNLEDGLTERKRGIASNDEIRKAVVSFANSVPDGCTAVLYIGVSDKGEVTGVKADDTEKIQQQIHRVCENDCFPAIAIRLAEVFEIEGKYVVGFEFGPSQNRPHFAGHAYMRIGAESVKASASKLEEMIAGKNTKAGRLISAKDNHELIKLVLPSRSLIPGELPLAQRRDHECKVEQCDAHSAKFYVLASQSSVVLPLEFLIFGVDRNSGRLLIEYSRIKD